jgi:DNA invertase Pin-like site-specific DNA recombinase
VTTVPQAPKRAALYARVATTSQDGGAGRRLADQLRAGEAYCAGRGYRVVARYEDVGSGLVGPEARTGLRALLADVLAGRIDAVVVTDYARLSRSAGVLDGTADGPGAMALLAAIAEIAEIAEIADRDGSEVVR